ncbi:hypothetical protein CES85_5126 [Ochrobactrum quorumnocens]|uniref:Uncharacterized protein n=1 Tax=Ochrobactrum quorumnocens TaxID=271865 RepID=A0A248UCK4_9HYPH|nr:hypothetical protein CES85_5126 [[Ochrobactrum] quorumnocens]
MRNVDKNGRYSFTARERRRSALLLLAEAGAYRTRIAARVASP